MDKKVLRGLKINERLEKRTDIEILKIILRKEKILMNVEDLLNEADIVFLCLPDLSAKESVSLLKTTIQK